MTTAFGRYVGTCDLPFSGDVDLVRIWTGALSAGAVQETAARELGGRPGPPPQPGPLPAVAPPTRVRADRPDRPPGSAPGAPARACMLSVSRTRIAAGRRRTVRVRVTIRGEPARSVRVVARLRGRTMPISQARTGRRGRARLKLRVRRRGRVRLSVAGTPRCAPAYIRVIRPR